MKTAVFGYIPPKGKFCSDAFWQNLKDFPPKSELILYSDDNWGPDVIRLKASPEIFKDASFRGGPNSGQHNPFAIHNGIFLAGLKMCLQKGVTHALYLEQDCRVGADSWDEVVFEEFFSIGRPCVVAGTVSVYNPSNFGVEALQRFYRHYAKAPAHGVPTPTYGWSGADKPCQSCAFPNGALGIYDVAWLTSLFNVEEQVAMATQNTAFDMAFGAKLWELFGTDAYEVIGSLGSVYSGFGNVMTTEDYRKKLLTDKKVVAVHQIKGDWIP